MEWVGAQSAGDCARTEAKPSNKTFTPSDRDIRPKRRTKWIEEQAADAKLTTEMIIGSMMSDQNEAKLNEFPNSLTQDRSNTTRKMSSETQLDPHHRVSLESNSNELPLSLVDGLGPEIMNTDICQTYIHQKRIKDFSIKEMTMKSRINFPPPNDKIWGKVDQELNQILPTIFPDILCNQLTPTELSQKFDSWIHSYFVAQFGTKPERSNQTAQRKPRTNKALQSLRQQKKECKSARKALLKAGLAGTAAEKLLTKEWLSLVRKHNKLRVEMKRRNQIKEKIAAERSFKKDPHKFASTLFQKQQQSGSPSFSAETAFKYFQETYTDMGRDFVYTAPEGMHYPSPPNFIFSLRCPTHVEICKSIKRKRNGATPGFNALTYVPYKKYL